MHATPIVSAFAFSVSVYASYIYLTRINFPLKK